MLESLMESRRLINVQKRVRAIHEAVTQFLGGVVSEHDGVFTSPALTQPVQLRGWEHTTATVGKQYVGVIKIERKTKVRGWVETVRKNLVKDLGAVMIARDDHRRDGRWKLRLHPATGGSVCIVACQVATDDQQVWRLAGTIVHQAAKVVPDAVVCGWHVGVSYLVNSQLPVPSCPKLLPV